MTLASENQTIKEIIAETQKYVYELQEANERQAQHLREVESSLVALQARIEERLHKK